MTTITKEIYFGLETGEVVCKDHAGITLRASIENARKNQVNFKGLRGTPFVQATAEELEMTGLGCEYC